MRGKNLIINGEGLDNCFHIVLHASSGLRKMTDLCASFPYTIKIPFELEQGKSCPNGFFGTSIFIYLFSYNYMIMLNIYILQLMSLFLDVVGFLFEISPAEKIRSNSLWEKQIQVVLCQAHGILLVDGIYNFVLSKLIK